jgi:hypothetical protein
MIPSGKSNMHIEPVDTHGGSPVDANDESTDIHETATQRTVANPSDRKPRATRRMDNDTGDSNHSMRLDYGVDPYGSPLQNGDLPISNRPHTPKTQYCCLPIKTTV